MERKVVGLRNSVMMRKTPLRAKTGLKARKPWNPPRKPLQAGSGFKNTGSTLKTKTGLKAKKNIRKVGKVGKANIEARQMIAKKAEAMKLTHCELGPVLITYGINVCLYNFALAPAHRHKRAWYKGDAEKLADVKQWVAACVDCHDAIEHSAELTEAVFMRLRGEENL